MSIESLNDRLPDYAKDLKLNYSTLVRQSTELTDQQLWGTVVACALAYPQRRVDRAMLAEGAKL